MERDTVQIQLTARRSKDRMRAAREIGKQEWKECGPALLEAYRKEVKDPRTWETQKYMLWALGKIDYKAALEDIEPIVKNNLEHDAITNAAATAYVRLKRAHLHDAAPVLELLQFGGYSLNDGALNALGYDRMIPDETSMQILLQQSWDLHTKKQPGLMDLRYGIAAACAGWPAHLTHEFLTHCLETANGDTPLIYVAEKALKGKYVKLR